VTWFFPEPSSSLQIHGPFEVAAVAGDIGGGPEAGREKYHITVKPNIFNRV
jgi:hypothetical protein